MKDLLFSVFPSKSFVDLGIYQFGRQQCKPSHSFGPAARNHFLFHYVVSGKGILMADNSKGETITYNIKSMQGFMIFPEQITTYIADNDMPWDYIWIEFDGLKVKGLLESAGITPDNPVYRARMKDLRENMKDEMIYIAEHSDESPFHLIGHLYLFFDYLIRSAAEVQIFSNSTLKEFYVHEAIVYIEHNFQNNISVENIAEVCGLNRSYFGKIFKEAVGQTPQDFLLNFRMIKATELLRLTNLSIGDIGNAVGYGNALHFSRAFRNTYGIPPREWRNQNKIKKI